MIDLKTDHYIKVFTKLQKTSLIPFSNKCSLSDELQDEPVSKSLNITTLTDSYKASVRQTINEGFGLIAVDETNNNQIIAYMGNELWDRNNPCSLYPTENYKVSEEEKTRNEFAKFVYSQFDPWQHGVDKVLHMRGAVVHSAYRGRSILKRFIQHMMEYAAANNIPMVLVVTTGKFSTSAFEKLGFTKQFHMNYSDYKDVNGNQVFSSDGVHFGLSLFTKMVDISVPKPNCNDYKLNMILKR